MYKEFHLNNPCLHSDAKALKLLNHGICRIDSASSDARLSNLRHNIETLFEQRGYPRNISTIHNTNISEFLSDYYRSDNLKDFFSSLSIATGEKVTVFPFISVMRNYFSAPQIGLDGWHDDADGEHQYCYCRKKMSTGRYVFGKLSISLQHNGPYGGNIDIAPSIYSLLRRKSLRKSAVRKIAALSRAVGVDSLQIWGDQWLYDAATCPLIKPNSINPEPLELIAFHHFLLHRGTPISPCTWNKITKQSIKAFFDGHYLRNLDLGPHNKYMMYIQFGNMTGLLSYLYDRSRRADWNVELKKWLDQYQELNFFMSDYPESFHMFKRACKELSIDL